MVELNRYLLFNSLVSWGVLLVFVVIALAGQNSSPPPPGTQPYPNAGPGAQTGYDLGYTLAPIILGLVVAGIVDAAISRVRN